MSFFHPNRWHNDIEKFKKDDANSFPLKNAILFVGNSNIRRWKLQQYFPDKVTLNRGFGGSYVSDSLYYAADIIIPYEPNMIVFSAGDNDIIDGKTPSMIVSQFGALEKRIHSDLPGTVIIVLSIKPTIYRWHLWPCASHANDLLSQYCAKNPNCRFLDVSSAMLNDQNMPRAELFEPDMMHLNSKGYQLWADMLGPLLSK
ncbi:MAG: hypothetical protein A2Y07_03620 [Planctomycetes bacterium GWF2_50_10]|nr:MAG: hypothetical protein A2Y07_03620 [Planctomycetes bacterium GWF2_50_10]